jgi:capsular exopolysaccharide synthesis family protein
VLLIDADMRKPQMHYRLGLNNLMGLSNILTEDNIRWTDAVQPVKNHAGWSVITSGRRPPDPTRLLSSARMHQMAQEISQSGQFDLVIYDTPPVLGLADAMLTSEHVDGLILLVSLDRVDRNLPKEAIKRIEASGASLLGLVTNAVKPESAQADGYGYGYGKYGSEYGYGYGYGAYNKPSYAYYHIESELSADSPDAQQQPTLPLWRQRLKTASRQVVRWIDR